MFKNAGLKLSILANILFALIVICCVIILFAGGMNNALTLFHVIFIVIALLGGYVSCLAVAAFGDLVEDVRSINLHLSVANKIALRKNISHASNETTTSEFE